jgi:hypothetical protein
MCSDLQFLGDLATDDDWYPYNHAAKRCKGRKESFGKETDVLDPDEHFDVTALLLRLGLIWGSRDDTRADMEKVMF